MFGFRFVVSGHFSSFPEYPQMVKFFWNGLAYAEKFTAKFPMYR
jgi:hypothetical protein